MYSANNIFGQQAGPVQPTKARVRSRTGRRRRISIGEGVLIALTCALVCTALVAVRPGAASADMPTRAIRVRAADTLWDIASRNRVDDLSTAQTVEVLKKLNRLGHSEIAVGQTLLIPTAEEPEMALASP